MGSIFSKLGYNKQPTAKPAPRKQQKQKRQHHSDSAESESDKSEESERSDNENETAENGDKEEGSKEKEEEGEYLDEIPDEETLKTIDRLLVEEEKRVQEEVKLTSATDDKIARKIAMMGFGILHSCIALIFFEQSKEWELSIMIRTNTKTKRI